MAKDLLKHLEELEAFGARFDGKAGVRAPDHDWSVLPEERSPDARPALGFLERLGAMPEVVYPRGALSVEEWAMGARPPWRFHTIDGGRLEEALCKLPSVEVLVELLREGVGCGALTVMGDRVLVNLPGAEGEPVQPAFEITDVVKRASAALKAREASVVLQQFASVGSGDRGSRGAGGPPFPGLVRVRQQPNRARPVLREGPDDEVEGVRRRMREFVKRHPVVADLDDVGEDTVFLVKGGPVRLADGTYLPLEIVEEEARRSLLDQMKRRGRSPRTSVYARAEELEPVPIPEELLAVEEIEEGIEGSDLPSPARIELAYRLMKGIQLDPEAGESLDVSTRSRFERVLGHGFSNVKLHTGPAARWIAESLSARAVTAGEHVFIPRERLQEGARGQQTLAHELVHVKQQAQQAEARPRAELESEARAAEVALGSLPEMKLATTMVPAVPRPGQPEQQGVFMAEADAGPRPAASGQSRRHIDLRSEEILEKLEEQIRESEEREKEEARDRVF